MQGSAKLGHTVLVFLRLSKFIGAALGRHGGAWAHDETRKSFGIAGPRVIDSLTLSLPIPSLDGRHPRESAEVIGSLREVVALLVAEIG